MILRDIAMVAADTTRTEYYLNELIRNEVIPNYVLVLVNAKKELLPGQKEAVEENSLVSLLISHGVKYGLAKSSDINSDEVVLELSLRPENVFIYSGYGGVILKKNILSIGKKFLHIHGGYIPNYKGSTTNYYSILEKNKMGASAIFLNKKIDSGPIINRKEFCPPKNKFEIDYFYDSYLRGIILVNILKQYKIKKAIKPKTISQKNYKNYFIIHPVLKHIALLK